MQFKNAIENDQIILNRIKCIQGHVEKLKETFENGSLNPTTAYGLMNFIEQDCVLIEDFLINANI